MAGSRADLNERELNTLLKACSITGEAAQPINLSSATTLPATTSGPAANLFQDKVKAMIEALPRSGLLRSRTPGKIRFVINTQIEASDRPDASEHWAVLELDVNSSGKVTSGTIIDSMNTSEGALAAYKAKIIEGLRGTGDSLLADETRFQLQIKQDSKKQPESDNSCGYFAVMNMVDLDEDVTTDRPRNLRENLKALLNPIGDPVTFLNSTQLADKLRELCDPHKSAAATASRSAATTTPGAPTTPPASPASTATPPTSTTTSIPGSAPAAARSTSSSNGLLSEAEITKLTEDAEKKTIGLLELHNDQPFLDNFIDMQEEIKDLTKNVAAYKRALEANFRRLMEQQLSRSPDQTSIQATVENINKIHAAMLAAKGTLNGLQAFANTKSPEERTLYSQKIKHEMDKIQPCLDIYEKYSDAVQMTNGILYGSIIESTQAESHTTVNDAENSIQRYLGSNAPANADIGATLESGTSKADVKVTDKDSKVTVFKMEVRAEGIDQPIKAAILRERTDTSVKSNIYMKQEDLAALSQSRLTMNSNIMEQVAEHVKIHLRELTDEQKNQPIKLRVGAGANRLPDNMIKAYILYCAHKNVALSVPPEYRDYQRSVTSKNWIAMKSKADIFAEAWKKKHPDDVSVKEERKLNQRIESELRDPPRMRGQ